MSKEPDTLADELLRPQLDILRRKLEGLPNKTPEDHEVRLEFGPVEQCSRTLRRIQCAQLIIRSGSRNALSGRMISELTERLDELERWSSGQGEEAEAEAENGTGQLARCLLVRGHNDTFCSGSDLIAVRASFETLAATPQEAGRQLAQLMQYNYRRLAELPLVSVAFVQGYALGGGAELALSADFRLMSDSGRLGFVHARNGICCGWSGARRLLQLVGRARALEIMSSGRLVGPEEAQRLGLCEQRAESLEEALEFIKEHAVGPPEVSRAVKALVALDSRPLISQLECQLIGSTWGGRAHLQALERNVKHKG